MFALNDIKGFCPLDTCSPPTTHVLTTILLFCNGGVVFPANPSTANTQEMTTGVTVVGLNVNVSSSLQRGPCDEQETPHKYGSYDKIFGFECDSCISD
ncbi:hypothetical protein C0Q70_17082 [Pomacea canaliculata]|uniref:Uncharacterized protein n=1 Tax=Pomacea canaliculata TaxID=400727 RepID=A0A2T7NRN0_POMCA|nr:hypothetical protein C0Q70_17082 [Pomacea canaliculata]